MKRIVSGLLLTIGLLVIVSKVDALIASALPLQTIIQDSDPIFTVKVSSVDADKPSMMLVADETLKGKLPWKELPVNLTGDADAKKLNHREALLKRVAKDVTMVLFLAKDKDNYKGFGYTNGTWFQILGIKDDDSDKIRWQFTHCEPALRGTYKGTTDEMKKLVAEVVAGKKSAPPINSKEKPGLGPELESKEKPQSFKSERSTSGPMFAVIPSVVVGGPLAILAMLFPAVFGGLLLVLRRWMAVLTVASINSLLYMLYSEFGSILSNFNWLEPVFRRLRMNPAKAEHFLQGLHLDEPVNLWIAMLIVTLIGTVWAWRRHLAAVQAQAELTAFNPAQPTMLPFFRSQTTAPSSIAEQPTASVNAGALPPLPSARTSGTQLILAEAPRRGEHIALWVISAIGFLGAAYCGITHTSVLAQPWITLLVMWIGIWCGTLYAAYLGVTQFSRSPLRTGLPLEGIILLVMTIAGACFAGSFGTASAADPDAGISVLGGAKGSEDEVSGIVARGVAWKFQAPGKGFIDSTPFVDAAHDRVYVAVATNTLIKQSGMLYCLGKTVNEQSGREEWKVVWKFDNNGQMKQVFCSPCLANGKIYIGEGLHQDSNCMMFCLDAATGQEVWQFRTDSHTESSPCYWEGKLYFGAGDDGLYCVDAETGEKKWNYQVDSDDIEKRLHIDANPTVVDGRVYCSSGVGDRGKTTAVFCIDAVTGKEIWRHATDIPVWGGSVVDGDRVYFGLGNEGYVAEQENPEGALLCVDRKTGEKIWRFNTKGAVLGRSAIDGQHVYFGSRDEFFYCLDRVNGDVVWKQNLGSPVVISPSLVALQCSSGQSPLCIYTMNDTGKLFCLNPADGEALWSFEAIKASGIKPSESYPPQFLSSPSVSQSQADKGVKHRIHFGCGIGDDFGYKAVFFCFEAEVGIAPHQESRTK